MAVHAVINRQIPSALCGRTGRGNALTAEVTYKSSDVTCKWCLPIITKIKAKRSK